MKIGVNTLFLLPFDFEEGLDFAQEQGVEMKTMGLDALDDLWQLAKREETIEKESR